MPHTAIHRGKNVIGESSPVQWHNTLANETIAGDLTIAEGERWLIGENVRVDGHIFVKGEGTVLGMRPGSSLIMTGGDENLYVGGGLTYESQDNTNDIGIWVWAGGKLDIQGTQKQSWNRTGTDPTWEAGDEYYAAPTGDGNYDPTSWSLGDPVTRRTIPAGITIPSWIPQDWIDNGIPIEIANVTRDITLTAEGACHIHIHSTVPQTVHFARIEGFGVFVPGEGQSLGRYALHHHFAGDVTGESWKGLAFINSKGRVMVPHESHGITIKNCVSVNSYAEGFWWDIGDDTNDLLIDEFCVMGVDVSREINGGTPRYNGVTLGAGFNTEMRNTAVSGVRSKKPAAGFNWPSGGQAVTYDGQNPVWIFETENIVHNCWESGLRFWTNLGDEHDVNQYVSYDNGEAGIENGAYQNRVSYFDSLLLNDYFFQQSNTKASPTQQNERVTVYNPGSPAIQTGHRNLPSGDYSQYVDLDLTGNPKVRIKAALSNTNPWLADFRDCGVVLSDFVFDDPAHVNEQGTHIRIFEGGVLLYEIEITGGARVDTDHTA